MFRSSHLFLVLCLRLIHHFGQVAARPLDFNLITDGPTYSSSISKAELHRTSQARDFTGGNGDDNTISRRLSSQSGKNSDIPTLELHPPESKLTAIKPSTANSALHRLHKRTEKAVTEQDSQKMKSGEGKGLESSESSGNAASRGSGKALTRLSSFDRLRAATQATQRIYELAKTEVGFTFEYKPIDSEAFKELDEEKDVVEHFAKHFRSPRSWTDGKFP